MKNFGETLLILGLRFTKFNRMINDCSLIGLGFKSNRFTWINLWRNGGLIQQRLNIMFASLNWRTRFPSATVSHLTKFHSDHYPLLLNTNGDFVGTQTRNFRLEPMWFDHPGFELLVANIWEDANHCINTAILNFPPKVSIWKCFSHTKKKTTCQN